MSGPLSFKAQALDNTSPDHYQIGDEILPDEDHARPRQVTNVISEVARKGTPVLKAGGAELILQGPRFLVQVYSVERDRAGRRAPILCCGEFSRSDDPQAIIQAIERFAKNIGRTVEPGHIQAIRDSLAKLKKSKSPAIPLAVGIGVAVVLAALMMFALHQRRSQRSQMQGTPIPSIRMQTPEG